MHVIKPLSDKNIQSSLNVLLIVKCMKNYFAALRRTYKTIRKLR